MPLRLPLALAVLALAVVAALAAVAPEPARAMCVSSVVVDGHRLIGHSADRALLPPRGPEREVVDPACNDAGQGDPDRTVRARTLDGIPAAVAVVRGEHVFVDEDSLPVLGDHPLHRAIAAGHRQTSYRSDGTCRREEGAQRGTVAANAGTALELRRADRTVPISVDARTQIAGAPAYQPVRAGQRVTLRTSLCGPRRVADAIRLTGPVPAAERRAPTARREATLLAADTDAPTPWIAAAAGAGLALAALGALSVARRRRRTTED